MRETVLFVVSNASARGRTSSNIGGSAGENAEVGGVILAVDIDERDEFDARSGNIPGPGLGVKDNANPDFCPNDLEIDVEPASVR